MKDFIRDLKVINKAAPLIWGSITLVALMAAIEVLRLVFAFDSDISFTAVIAGALLSIAAVTFLNARVSGQRYALLTSLPIRAENVPRAVFRLFELTVYPGFAVCIIMSLVFGKISEAFVFIMVGVIFAIIGYVLLMLSAAPECASGLGSGGRMAAYMTIYFAVGILSGVLVAMSEENVVFSPVVYFSALGVLAAANLVLRHFAFKKYIKTIRVMKKEED